MENIIKSFEQINNNAEVLHLNIITGIIINVFIIIALFKAADLLDKRLKERIAVSSPDSPVLQFLPVLNKVIKGLVLFFIIASFLQSSGYSITSLIAGFGITGLAIGFAAQQTIADFFGTFIIIADKMYKPGDFVKIGDVEGTVECINVFSTKVRTLDDFLVTVPNNNISGTNIVNLSRAHKRRINEIFGVTYDTSDEKLHRAIEIIHEVCDKNDSLHKKPVVFVETLAASSINIKLLAYVKTNSYNRFAEIRSDVILEIVKRFREENISFAFPSQSVYIEKK